jgi:hypothetical protein
MDDLEAVQWLLAERPAPAPDVVAAARTSLERAGAVLPSGLPPVPLNGDGPMAGPGPAADRRWRGWLAPVAAAVAVAAAIGVSVAISGTVGSHARRPTASTPAVFRQVPRFFVTLTGHAVPEQGERAEAVATATGAVLGSVTVPRPYQVFTEVAAAGDDRTFVLAAQRGTKVTYVGGRHGPLMYYGSGPARFYKLVLARSGRPATLTALPLAAVTGDLNGFALSPDGSKLAVSALPTYSPRSGQVPPSRGAQLVVFSLATGARRVWRLPGPGAIGMNKPNAQSLSWAGDNRTLLFQERLRSGGTVQIRLLDTAAPGGSLLADSRLVPFSQKMINEVTFGVILLSADGTKIIAATTTRVLRGGMTARQLRSLAVPRRCLHHGDRVGPKYRYSANQKTPYCQKIIREHQQRFKRIMAQMRKDGTGLMAATSATFAELSVRTGKPVRVLDRMRAAGDTGADVDWASAAATAMIVDGPAPDSTGSNPRIVLGVLASGTFTPLPRAVQAFLYSATW